MATAAEKGFQEALKKFRVRLSDREDAEFQFTSLDDLRRALLKIQTKQAQRAAAMNLPRIQGILEAFRQFGQVIEVFPNSSNFVAYIWGPIKFLLQVSEPFRALHY